MPRPTSTISENSITRTKPASTIGENAGGAYLAAAASAAGDSEIAAGAVVCGCPDKAPTAILGAKAFTGERTSTSIMIEANQPFSRPRKPPIFHAVLMNFIIAVRLKTEQIQLAADCVSFECGSGFGKCLGHRHFLEDGDRENLEQSVEGGFQGEALLDDGNEDVNRYGDPDLRLHRVVRRAVELFDPKVLLDPFEKQFDLPAALVEGADRRGRKGELVA